MLFSQALHQLRSYWLRCAVLACFACAVMAATASAWVKPQSIELLCSGSGMSKLLVKNADGEEASASHSLDCALCLPTLAPPPLTAVVVQAARLLAYATQPIAAAQIAALTQPPLPARGPPLF